MKIGITQMRAIKGDIPANITRHQQMIHLAIAQKADKIFFPELSLTGYEPALARELALELSDERLSVFQKLSNDHRLTIGMGAPLFWENGIGIGMILFEPFKSRQVYGKLYLHADEMSFFISMSGSSGILSGDRKIALAICYEISVPLHAQNAFDHGAEIYVASVVKFESGIDKAFDRLSEIARQYSMTVMMANSVGEADGLTCAGRSAIWNQEGQLLAQLNDSQEGILLIDTETASIDFHCLES